MHSDGDGYSYKDAESCHAHHYLLPKVSGVLDCYFRTNCESRRVFDLGCGNGSVAAELARAGYEVIGVDPSTEGIAQASKAFPHLRLEIGSAYDDLSSKFGQFPAVVSLEVVEHVYAPREFATTLYSLVAPGGFAVVSTPYHGYVKNLALAITGKMDQHFTAMWDHGHIKFWSIKTLRELLEGAGFVNVCFHRVGRFKLMAKSMIAIAQRPSIE